MNVRVVIARHAEPIGWVRMLPRDWDVVIYNKGSSIKECFGATVVDRPNIGREAETFCFHNSSVLPCDYTIYLQGNPFDHCIGLVEIAEAVMLRRDRVGWLGFHFDTSWNGHPHTPEDLGLRNVWARLGLRGACPRSLAFSAGAQMVVSGEYVSSRSAAWWAMATDISATEDWRVAHCFERLWPTIYSKGEPS
jgi:hypothetical protein